jgi:hypothetical protein
MTKRFALADTLPDPYITIYAGADAALVVNVAACQIGGDRMAVEVWRDQTILCRLIAKSVQVAEEPSDPNELGHTGKE